MSSSHGGVYCGSERAPTQPKFVQRTASLSTVNVVITAVVICNSTNMTGCLIYLLQGGSYMYVHTCNFLLVEFYTSEYTTYSLNVKFHSFPKMSFTLLTFIYGISVVSILV